MKPFLLVVAAILLPFGPIGCFTYATFLPMRDGGAAGTLPAWLFMAGIIMVVAVGICIFHLNRLYAARRGDAGTGGGTY